MEKKNTDKELTFMDINSEYQKYCNPKKTWKELLQTLHNISKNFHKSQIDPEELKSFLVVDEKNKNSIPTEASITLLISTIDRYITEYKIPPASTLFLEFKRHAAVYLFSIGSSKSLEMLKSILMSISDVKSDSGNEDINLYCVKNCIRINQAAIHFWMEDYEEAKPILDAVISEYENSKDELEHIKMCNFISVALTYSAWILCKQNNFEDAEKAFYHSLKILTKVKSHTKNQLKEEHFIDTKTRKVFIYDQMIHYYTYTRQIEEIQAPLNEILKIMDKDTFTYDMDLGPKKHAYYFFYSVSFILNQNLYETIDLSKALRHMINIIIVIYRNTNVFDMIPRVFYENIMELVRAVHLMLPKEENEFDTSETVALFKKDLANPNRQRIMDTISRVRKYICDVINKSNEEKDLFLNPNSSGSVMDNIVTLESFKEFEEDGTFPKKNYIKLYGKEQKEYNEGIYYPLNFEINEIYLIKMISENLLHVFAANIRDINECEGIEKKICMEGINGFLVIKNEELLLYSISRFMVRGDNKHKIYEESRIGQEEDFEPMDKEGRKYESLKIISVKSLDPKFGHLYYRKVSFKLIKDTKTFNYAMYFYLVHLLYSKKLYYPCITLLSLYIEEVSELAYELYQAFEEGHHQKSECFLYLFEFALLFEVYILILVKNFHRALYELLRIKKTVNDVNEVFYKTMLGFCLSQCLYFDISIVILSEAYYLIDPLLEQYREHEEIVDPEKDAKAADKVNPQQAGAKKQEKVFETYYTEMKVLANIIKGIIQGVLEMKSKLESDKTSVCFRCRMMDLSKKFFCLKCKEAVYCSKKCMKKNEKLHLPLCKYHNDNYALIEKIKNEMSTNFDNIKN